MAELPINKVTGHLEERNTGKRTIYHAKMAWNDENGEYQRTSKTTGLTVKGNKTRAEAMLQDFIREQEESLNEALAARITSLTNQPVQCDNVLFSNFIEHDWLEAIRRGDRKAAKKKVKPTTFGGYQTNVQKSIAPYFKDRSTLLKELTAENINDFYDSQYQRGASGSTVLNFHANIVSSLRYAARKEYIASADIILKNVLRPNADDYVAKPYNESEAMELIKTVKGHRLELGVIIGAFYGLRRSELVGLRWEAIDFDANTITIEHTVTVAKIDGKRIIVADDTAKSKSSFRSLPLVPIIRAKLLEIKAEQEYNRKLCGRSYNKAESAYIYTDVLGNRIKPDYLSSEFPKFLKKHGLRRIRFHDLRHTSARLLLASGVSLKAIQEWLGHSTFKTTADIYARFDGSSNQESAKALTWFENTSLAQEMAGAI
jgi:integrase